MYNKEKIMYFGSLLDDGNTKEEQGEYGEFRVKNKILIIREQLGECYLYNDNYLKSDGAITQIDHILLTQNGIFVIETKAVSGKLYADLSRYERSSNVYGKVTCFPNPVRQNEYHINLLKNYLGDGIDYHSVIVFTERNKPENVPDFVLNIRELQSYLLNFTNKNKLSSEELKHIKNSLDELQKNKFELKAIHKKQIRNN